MVSIRREVRFLVVQTLFENDFNGNDPDYVLYLETYNRLAKEYNPSLMEDEFAKKLLKGITSKYEELNKIIEHAAIDWSLEKIGSVDRNILRLGAFEVLFGKEFDVPGCVALNEAIEITKTFLDDSSRKFVNGVLGAIYSEVKDPNEAVFTPKKTKYKKSVGSVIFRTDEDEVKFAFVHDIFG